MKLSQVEWQNGRGVLFGEARREHHGQGGGKAGNQQEAAPGTQASRRFAAGPFVLTFVLINVLDPWDQEHQHEDRDDQEGTGHEEVGADTEMIGDRPTEQRSNGVGHHLGGMDQADHVSHPGARAERDGQRQGHRAEAGEHPVKQPDGYQPMDVWDQALGELEQHDHDHGAEQHRLGPEAIGHRAPDRPHQQAAERAAGERQTGPEGGLAGSVTPSSRT